MTGTIDRVFVRRNLDGTLRRYRVVLVLIAVGAAALLVVSAIIGQGAAAVSSSLSTGSAISAIQLSSVSTRGTPTQLDGDALERVRAVDDVLSVEPWAQEGLFPEDPSLWIDDGTPLIFWATPRIAAVQPDLVAGTDVTGPGDIVLPDRVGEREYTDSLGRTLQFSYTVRTGVDTGVAQMLDLTVVGLYDNSTPGQDGDAAAYVSQDLVSLLLAARAGMSAEQFDPDTYIYPAAYVQVASADRVPAVQSVLVDEGFAASSIVSQVAALPRVLALLGYVNLGIAAVLVLFCLGAGLVIGSAALAQRGREVGLLRALGWTRRRVLRALLTEVGVAGLACAVVACVVGLGVSLGVNLALGGSSALGLSFADGVTLPAAPWLLVVLVGLPLALVLGAARPIAVLARTDPDDALRQL